VLHSWNQRLQFHPHVHCVLAAGGLADSICPPCPHSIQMYSLCLPHNFTARLELAYLGPGPNTPQVR
jgi:hypothetical protein